MLDVLGIVTRQSICSQFLRKGFQNRRDVDIVTKIVAYLNRSDSEPSESMFQSIKQFVSNWARSWRSSGYSWNKFVESNSTWLDQPLLNVIPPPHQEPGPSKRKLFCDLSKSQKNRITKDLRDTYPSDVLTYVAASVLRQEKNVEAANAIAVAVSTPKDVKGGTKHAFPETYSPDEAVALFIIKGRQTKEQYRTMQLAANWKNIKAYPSYHTILSAKKACYPIQRDAYFTDVEAKVSLQNLVDRTMERLLPSIIKNKTNMEVVATYEWGMDGSSGHPQFNQRFMDPTNSDATVFCTNMVPLFLKHKDTILWRNSTPNSPSLCRPLRMAFCKEDSKNITEEFERVQSEINSLEPTKVHLQPDVEISVTHEFKLTMIDGKVINVLTNNPSTNRCPVCSAGSKMLNTVPETPPNRKVLQLGISPLHAKINCMQFLLKCAYKLRSPRKDEIQNRKQHIQRQFKERTGLIIDKPKPGFGLSNDGNTARRFFRNPALTAEITELEPIIIERFAEILAAISFNRVLSASTYKKYALETAEIFKATYPQFTFSPTVHKLLFHGSEYISMFPTVALGALSEEAQEVRNKDFKRYRADFTRKIHESRPWKIFSTVSCSNLTPYS